MTWTDERIERLTKMWEGGATASQIADELGGVTRNAVIGKAHRLGLKARPSPVKANEQKDAEKGRRQGRGRQGAAPGQGRHRRPPRPAAEVAPAMPPPGPVPTRRRAAGAAALGARDDAYRSVGPGGFLRQGPGDQQAPIPPAPPRRLVPAKPSAEIADKTSLLDLNDRVCRWPMGHPGEPDFHFCGAG